MYLTLKFCIESAKIKTSYLRNDQDVATVINGITDANVKNKILNKVLDHDDVEAYRYPKIVYNLEFDFLHVNAVKCWKIQKYCILEKKWRKPFSHDEKLIELFSKSQIVELVYLDKLEVYYPVRKNEDWLWEFIEDIYLKSKVELFTIDYLLSVILNGALYPSRHIIIKEIRNIYNI